MATVPKITTQLPGAKPPAKKKEAAAPAPDPNAAPVDLEIANATGRAFFTPLPTMPALPGQLAGTFEGPWAWLSRVNTQGATAAPPQGAPAPAPGAGGYLPGSPQAKAAQAASAAQAPAGAGATPAPAGGPSQASQAQSLEDAWLANMGLGSIPGVSSSQLYQWALGEIQKGVTDPNVFAEDAQNSSWFQARFPGMKKLADAGLPPMTVADYLAYEKQVAQSLTMGGLPANTLNESQIADAMGKGITTSEIENQVTTALTNVSQAAKINPDAYNLMQKWYGVGKGGIAAYLLTGDMSAIQAQTAAVQLGATAENAGFTNLSQAQMYAAVGNQGSAEAGAATKVMQASALMPLTQTGQAKNLQSPTINQETLLEGELGVQAPGEKTVGEAQRQGAVAVGTRVRAFGGGGGYAGGQPGAQGGTTGLGSTGGS